MNELNIYGKFKFRKLLRSANLYFNNKYRWYCPHRVFAPHDGKYTLSLNRNNIRICYWDEETEEGVRTKEQLRDFLYKNLRNLEIGITCKGKCDIIKGLSIVNRNQL